MSNRLAPGSGRLIFLIMFLSLFFASASLIAQTIRPLPRLYYKKVDGEVAFKEFEKKANVLQAGGVRYFDESLMHVSAVKGFIGAGRTGNIRVYYAHYKAGAVTIKGLQDNTIIFLFSESDNGTTAWKKQYYYLCGNLAAPLPIEEKTAEEWIRIFVTNDLPLLDPTIDLKDPDNIYKGVASDTKSIMYSPKEFTDAFVAEPAYLAKESLNIFAFKPRFSAYTEAGRSYLVPNSSGLLYRKRLFMQFVLVQKTGAGKEEEFYLENVKDYAARLKALEDELRKNPGNLARNERHTGAQFFTLDNGHLCPTNCPPDTP